jgi:putative ABC transport system permease protein
MNFSTELKEGIKVSWSAIRANKMRSILTTLGIVIGIVTVTLMGAAISGLNKAFLNSISALGSDVLFVEKFEWFSNEEWWKMRNRKDITLEMAHSLQRQLTLAAAVSAFADTFTTVKYNNLSATSIQVVGCEAEAAIIGGATMDLGRFLSADEVAGARPVCVLGADIAAKFFPHETPLGKKILIGNSPYEVVGVRSKVGQFLGILNLDNQVMIPITKYLSEMTRWPNVTIQIKVKDPSLLDDAKEEVRSVMRKIRKLAPGDPDDFAINQQEAFIRTFNKIGGVIAGVGLFITGLSLFVGGIGIMNIMFVSVVERTREIGLRKALGARNRTILLQFLIEAASICIIGGLIGLAIAWPTCMFLKTIFPATMSLKLVALSLCVSTCTGIISGFLPAWRAAKMSPVEALRNE